jgi:type II secretory pathway component GspD/PulD (secretin)
VPALKPLEADPNAPRLRQVIPRKVVERVRKVIVLKDTPAFDVAESINKLLKDERPSRLDEVTVVAEPIGNRLLVSATPSMLEEVLQLVEEIDVQPKSVVIEGLIAVVERADKAAAESPLARFREVAPSKEMVAALIEELKKNPNVEFLARPTVTVVNNQPAFVQFGRRVPTVKTKVTDKGRTSNVEYENVGIIFGVTSRVCDDNRVTMEIDLEKSDVVGNDGAGASIVDVTVAQTTVTTESGQPVVLGGLKAETSSSAKEVILIATPRILDGTAK